MKGIVMTLVVVGLIFFVGVIVGVAFLDGQAEIREFEDWCSSEGGESTVVLANGDGGVDANTHCTLENGTEVTYNEWRENKT